MGTTQSKNKSSTNRSNNSPNNNSPDNSPNIPNLISTCIEVLNTLKNIYSDITATKDIQKLENIIAQNLPKLQSDIQNNLFQQISTLNNIQQNSNLSQIATNFRNIGNILANLIILTRNIIGEKINTIQQPSSVQNLINTQQNLNSEIAKLINIINNTREYYESQRDENTIVKLRSMIDTITNMQELINLPQLQGCIQSPQPADITTISNGQTCTSKATFDNIACKWDTITTCVTPSPPVITTPPPVITIRPPVITTRPPVITTPPPVITTPPPVITTRPPVITTQPPVITTRPPVITTQPMRTMVPTLNPVVSTGQSIIDNPLIIKNINQDISNQITDKTLTSIVNTYDNVFAKYYPNDYNKNNSNTYGNVINKILEKTPLKLGCCSVSTDKQKRDINIPIRVPLKSNNTNENDIKFGFEKSTITIPANTCPTFMYDGSEYCNAFMQATCNNVTTVFNSNKKLIPSDYKDYAPECACYAPISAELSKLSENIPPKCYKDGCLVDSQSYIDPISRSKGTCDATICTSILSTGNITNIENMNPVLKNNCGNLLSKQISSSISKLPTVSTTTKLPINIGDKKIDVVSSKEFKIGMTVQIGSGNNIDTGKVTGFGSIIIDTPTKYYHPPNTVIKGFDNTTNSKVSSNSDNSMMYISIICAVIILIIIIFYFLNQSPQNLESVSTTGTKSNLSNDI